MRTCDYCGVARKARHFLSMRVTKSQDSIKRYVAKLYAKHPNGVPPDSDDFPKVFQGWIYKEHKTIICWSCCMRTTDLAFRNKVIKWANDEEIIKRASLIKETRTIQEKKPVKKVRAPAKSKKSKPKKKDESLKATRRPSKAASIRPYVVNFETAVNNVVVTIRTLRKHWNLSVITDKNRNKALRHINKSIKSLSGEKEEKFKI